MKSTKEKIEVMQAYENGETLQIMLRDENPCWTDAIIKNKEPEFRWGEFDYRIKPQEPQTDWSKVAKGTAVLVRDELAKEWQEAIFLEFDTKNKDCCYPFRYFNPKNSSSGWSIHCKLDKSAPSIINWLPYKNEIPRCKVVIIRYNDSNTIDSCEPKLMGYIPNIKEYAIIE